MNTYKPGRLGMAEGTALAFFLTFPAIFLTSPAIVLQQVGGPAWLAVLAYGCIPLIMFFVQLRVFQQVPSDFFDVTLHLLGRVGAWMVGLYYSATFFINYILLLRQFAENTLVTALPAADFSFIIFVYSITVALVVYTGIEGLSRSAAIILPLTIVSLLVLLLLLAPFYNIYRLAPWQGTGIDQLLSTSIKTSGINVGVFALSIIAPVFRNMKTLKTAALFGLGSSIIVRTLSVFVYTLTFGAAVGSEKVLPFYELARLVYLSRYVQRIEALFIILWVFAGILGMAASLYITLYLWTRLFKLPTMRPLVAIMALLAGELASLPPDVATVLHLHTLAIYMVFNVGIYVIPLILFIAWLFKRKAGVSSCAAE